MPAQAPASQVAHYREGDTAPTLSRQLLDGAGNPIALTGLTVTITIAHASHDYYYSPGERIVDRDPCVVDPDQITNPGWVHWSPGTDMLSPPGSYSFSYEVTYLDGGRETIPQNTELPMIIRSRTGGRT